VDRKGKTEKKSWRLSHNKTEEKIYKDDSVGKAREKTRSRRLQEKSPGPMALTNRRQPNDPRDKEGLQEPRTPGPLIKSKNELATTSLRDRRLITVKEARREREPLLRSKGGRGAISGKTRRTFVVLNAGHRVNGEKGGGGSTNPLDSDGCYSFRPLRPVKRRPDQTPGEEDIQVLPHRLRKDTPSSCLKLKNNSHDRKIGKPCLRSYNTSHRRGIPGWHSNPVNNA